MLPSAPLLTTLGAGLDRIAVTEFGSQEPRNSGGDSARIPRLLRVKPDRDTSNTTGRGGRAIGEAYRYGWRISCAMGLGQTKGDEKRAAV